MNAYLRKIVEEIGIEINKHFLQFPIKPCHYCVDRFIHDKLIYHKDLFYFFLRYPNTQGICCSYTPYRTYLNPPSNAIFVEFYEYVPKENNYLMKVLLLYLEFFYYSGLSVPTFVELYLFGAIKCIKENDVRFWMLFEKCTMAYFTSFYGNHSTFVINNPIFFFAPFFQCCFGLSNLIDFYC